MNKTVIELQNIKRNFQVGDETVHAGFRSPSPKESLSPLWVRPVRANQRY